MCTPSFVKTAQLNQIWSEDTHTHMHAHKQHGHLHPIFSLLGGKVCSKH